MDKIRTIMVTKIMQKVKQGRWVDESRKMCSREKWKRVRDPLIQQCMLNDCTYMMMIIMYNIFKETSINCKMIPILCFNIIYVCKY